VRRAALLLLAATAAAQEPGESIFDGRTLHGWDGDPRIWSVQDGAITGSSAGVRLTANTFLIWRGGELEDFELTCELRLRGSNNSGIQYRSRELGDDWQVAGYQADVNPQPDHLGMLYDERGRGIVALRGQRVEVDAEGGKRILGRTAPDDGQAIDLGQWHRMRIVARGNRLLHELDGVVTADVVDRYRDRRRAGLLALQVHAGPEMQVQYRSLRLRRLTAAPMPEWIWGPEQDATSLWFLRSFEVEGPVRRARLQATGDNRIEVWLNGARVLWHDEWSRLESADVGRRLVPGGNSLLVRGQNDGGPAAVLLRLSWLTEDGEQTLATDAGWLAAAGERAPAADRPQDWWNARSLGPAGKPDLPWSRAIEPAAFDDLPQAQPVRPAPQLRVPPGFVAELVYDVSRSQGSWVSLATAPGGRLFASDQRGGLYRITPPPIGDAATATQVERVPLQLGGAQGLLWAFDALYAVVNGADSGLYRLRDADRDGMPDRVEKLVALRGDGEHGPHGLILAAGGRSLLVTAGNHTKLPPLARSRFPGAWREDQLLPQLEDPGGHAVGIPAPGGWVCEVDPDGRQWELLAAGLRNTYDLALAPDGELFTFDSDMEWDIGLPWYRPTRILHLVSAADYGWRRGSGKWPASYPDSLPAALDVGPGSPTGVLFGTGASFPERYQRALFVLDWTHGELLAIHLAPDGASWRGARESFVAGSPLALTDAVVAADGAMYLTIGGRGTKSALFRVRYAGDEPVAAIAAVAAPSAGVARRRALERWHGRADPAALAEAWPLLGDPDRFLRHAARLAIEAQPVADWRERALAEREPTAALEALLALARCGGVADRAPLLQAWSRLPDATLQPAQRIAWLRVLALLCIRLGAPAPAERQQLLARLEPQLPSGDVALDRELAQLLVHLRSEQAIDRLLPRLATGAGLADAIHFAFLLRHVDGWQPEQRRRYFEFFPLAARSSGGDSYRGYLAAIRRDALARCAPAELDDLGRLARQKLEAPLPFAVAPPRGPARQWTVADAFAAADGRLHGRDFAAGRSLYFGAACGSCHRFAGRGGDLGPDLTSLPAKLSLRDQLIAILEPDRDVSDQYRASVVHCRDGRTFAGRVVRRSGDRIVEVHGGDPDVEPERIREADVDRIEVIPRSQMPPGLLHALGPDELLDLLAYLQSGGDPQAPIYQQR
jgi:putative heme-binding domain-containing protein